MLQVINGIEKVNKHDIYYKAYLKVLNNYKNDPTQDIKPILKKLIFYGVKTIRHKNKRETLIREEVESNFEFADIIRAFMANLTPFEFINIFPIKKEYNGHKWQSKDYFYTRNYIQGLEHDKPIGEGIYEFLWEYNNFEVTCFLVHLTCCMSDLRRLDGLPGIAEEWAKDCGIKTYTLHLDNNGNQYLYDSDTGKTTALKRRIPRYLKLVQ